MEAPKTKTQSLPPPPGIIGSLRAGFDAVASHITAILLPLALDALLWLGPRLSVQNLFQPLIEQANRDVASSGLPADQMQVILNVYKTIAAGLGQYNLLSTLRTFPIGITSLMVGKMPTYSPLGAPAMIQVFSFGEMIGWIGLLTLFGWIGGSLYFYWVARVAASEAETKTASAGQAVLQTIFLSILWTALLFAIALPGSFVLSVLYLISPLLAQGAILVLILIAMWLIVPVFFSPHGIFVRRQNAFASIFTSLRFARFTLPTSSLFVFSIFFIAEGLNLLWRVPPDNSWMTAVGILGHAFVTTALLAASFVYYRDMNAWLETVFERLKAGAATPPA